MATAHSAPLSLWRGNVSQSRIDRTVSLKSIAERVAAEHGVTVADLRGRSRARKISAIRQQAFAESWESGRSYPMIGRFYGRDHTTVLYGAQAHRKRVGA